MKLFIYRNGTGELHETIPDVLSYEQTDKCISIRQKPIAMGLRPNHIVFSKPEFFVRTLI